MVQETDSSHEEVDEAKPIIAVAFKGGFQNATVHYPNKRSYDQQSIKAAICVGQVILSHDVHGWSHQMGHVERIELTDTGLKVHSKMAGYNFIIDIPLTAEMLQQIDVRYGSPKKKMLPSKMVDKLRDKYSSSTDATDTKRI